MLWRMPTSNFWNPWSEFDRLRRDMDQLFTRYGSQDLSEYPAVNVWTDEEDALLTAELPGIDPKELEITVKNDTVTLRGGREAEEAKEGESYLRRERGSGTFVRTFALPFQVDSSKVEAEYKRGILAVKLPRAEADKPKKIEVTS